jgi:multidrug resistance efflux pump/GAF domain-containing protein
MSPDADSSLKALERLLRPSAQPSEFWSNFLPAALAFSQAEGGLILERSVSGLGWRLIAEEMSEDSWLAEPLRQEEDSLELADVATREGSCHRVLTLDSHQGLLLAVRLTLGTVEPPCVLILAVSSPAEPSAYTSLLSDLAALARRLTELPSATPGPLAAGLDLILQLNDQTHFSPAAMLFCNEIAASTGARRVSLLWAQDQSVRLAATSHTNKFERNMALVRKLEFAAQETFDQNEEIVWPAPPDQSAISADHETYAQTHHVRQLLSLPLRQDGEPTAVIVLERAAPPFTPGEIAAARLTCDLAVRRLSDLWRHGRGFWAAVEARVRLALVPLLGAEHTWLKVGSISGAFLLLFLFLFPWPYRVKGDFFLQSQTVVTVPAPFDSFVQQVMARPGDQVTLDQPLIELDRKDMRLDEAEARASQQRYQSEASVAEGDEKLANVYVAQAQAAQASAQLEQVRHKLQRATLRSPFDGFVLEGDQSQRVGSPLQKGDVLLRIGKLDAMAIRIKIPEESIQDVQVGATGRLTFASRPGETFTFRVTTLEPTAQPTKEGNMFVVRAEASQAGATWWRPGMSGLARIEAGTKPPIWLLTHRLLDFLRLKYWP